MNIMEKEGMMKEEFILDNLSPMGIILKGLRPTMDDEHEKKKLKERDEEWKEKVMKIIIRRPYGKLTNPNK